MGYLIAADEIRIISNGGELGVFTDALPLFIMPLIDTSILP